MKDLLDLLKNGDYTTFFIFVLIFIFIWLFKDMKKTLLETKKSDLNFIDQSIESHALSLKAVYFFLNNSKSENDLLTTLYSSYKYFDKHILEIVDKFSASSCIISQEEKSKLLITLSKELKGKITILKEKQLYQTVDKDYKLSIFYFWDTASKNNFDIYYNAFLYSLIILVISVTSLELIMHLYTLEPKTSVPLIVLIIGYLFWLFLLPISINVLLKKDFKKICLLILFSISPFVLTYFIHIFENYIFKIVILTIFIISISINFYVDIKYLKLLRNK
ncbi:hypothetical protein [Clostridium chromiireducens]|uniref:Uncharacterized protein n=1 Tax=Clostridium chromiireducens TaxID=225345 RepID=A0A1V4IUL8_9CLOT|nr:hypothetical protein [Clostridium chromiireducens]OPJ63722.1 hypothetical protein CLCHR_15370 [Clostridium chromiireducens]